MTLDEMLEVQNMHDDLMDQIKQAWKEAAIAWSVCASIHREYAKGKDPFFKTRQADFTKHESDARAQLNASLPPSPET